MAAQTITSADGVLKEFYLPAVRSQINQKIPGLELVQRGSEHVEGSEWVLSLHVSRNQGVGARLEDGALPTAGRQGYTDARGPLRTNTGRFEVTNQLINAMASDKGSYLRTIDSETKGLARDVQRDVNRQVYGTSDGKVAQCGTTTASTTVTLASTTKKSALRQLKEGMIVDIGTVANPTLRASARTVSSVDIDAKTLVVSGAAITTASTDFVFRSGAGGADGGVGQAELTGLQSIVAASGTLQGVDPSTYEVWVATVLDNDGTLRAVTDDVFEEGMDEVDIASGEEIDLWLTTYGVRREYADHLKTLKRSTNTIDLKGGFKGLDVTAGGKTCALVVDRDCPDNFAFGLNTSHLFSPEQSDWDWLDKDGAVLSRVSDKLNYEATLYKDHELATDMRNAHVLVKDLQE